MAPHSSGKGASARYERFVAEYLVHFNAAQAARACGSTAKRADQAGYELLRNPEVRRLLAARLKLDVASRGLTKERVLEEICRLAFFDPAQLYDDTGRLLPIHRLRPDVRAAITGMKVARANLDRTDGKRSSEWLHEVKYGLKDKGLEMLAKYFKLLTEVVEHRGDWDKLTARLTAARKRVKK